MTIKKPSIAVPIGLIASLCGGAAAPSAEVAPVETIATWPQWRGPSRTSFVAAVDSDEIGARWPDALQRETLTQIWRRPLGPSYSGPIVSETEVFVTETVDAQTEVVTALQRDTGDVIWRQSWPGSMSVPFFAKENGDWIRATPVYDRDANGETIYVAGMCDALVAIDARTGDVRWRRDFSEEEGGKRPMFGQPSSPLVDGDALYVQAGSAVMRLDKQTGKNTWTALREGDGAFSSPLICTLGGVRQLVVQTREKLAGVELADGKVLWEQTVPAFRGMNILTPSKWRDSIFTATYQGGSFLFGVSPAAEGLSVDKIWKSTAQGYMSSPVIIGNYAYMHMKNQRFACIDLQTGERTWTTEPYGKYWSMVAQGSRILALDSSGVLMLIDADPQEFRLLDRREVSDSSTWAHLAVAGDQVLVRSLDAVTLYRWSAKRVGAAED